MPIYVLYSLGINSIHSTYDKGMPIYLLYSLGINSIHSTYDKGRWDVPITYVSIGVIVDRIYDK
jgi:hypothetical protein